MKTFHMSDVSKFSLVKRIIAWESRGYEVCQPMQSITSSFKQFSYQDNNVIKSRFTGVNVGSKYHVKMKAVN